MLNEKKAIFFDLDDTLISFDGVSDKAWEESCYKIIEENKLIIDKQKLLKELIRQRKLYWNDSNKSKLGRKNIMEARYTIVENTLKNLHIYEEETVEKIVEKYSDIRDKLIYMILIQLIR